jgi:tetratricopeptide repeat protein 21B
LLHQNKSNEALELLKKVTEDKQLFYIQARQKMADIYLTIYKNKHRYIQCHKEIAKKIPGPSTAILLGDALIAVNEVEKALMVFETALKKTPSDGYLVSKVGQCHVKMHNYNKAVSYFEAALKSHEHADLRCELAVLYLRLFKYEQAERTLLLALEQNSSEQTDGIGQIKDKLKFYQLLTNIYCKNNEHLQAIKIFEKGRAYQALLVKQMSVNSPDGVNIGKNWLGNMLHQLAAQLTLADSQNSPKAELLFKEAINNCPDNAKYRESLCRWYLLRGQFDYCEQECFTLLKMDANNNNASFILAEVLYAKGEFFAAIKHFEAFLAKNSTCFDGIAILIDLYRRIGNLQKADKFIEYVSSFFESIF